MSLAGEEEVYGFFDTTTNVFYAFPDKDTFISFINAS